MVCRRAYPIINVVTPQDDIFRVIMSDLVYQVYCNRQRVAVVPAYPDHEFLPQIGVRALLDVPARPLQPSDRPYHRHSTVHTGLRAGTGG